MKPEDRREVEELIADRLEADSVAAKFAALDEREKEEIAQHISRFMYERRAAQRSPKNDYTPRWLWEDEDINWASAYNKVPNNAVGHYGPTLPRIINLKGGGAEAYLNAENPEELILRIRGGGGSDCMFDAIVSPCWADEVAFGRATEGQLFNSLTGCDYRVYSTVQGAFDGIPANTKWHILVCTGDYAEDVVLNDSTIPVPDITGAGYHTTQGTIIQSITLTDSDITGFESYEWKDFCIAGSGGTALTIASGNAGDFGKFVRLRFGTGTSAGGAISCTNVTGLVFENCHIAMYSSGSSFISGENVQMLGCLFQGASADTHKFNFWSAGIGIEELRFVGNYVEDTTISFGTCQSIVVTDNIFSPDTDSSIAQLLEIGSVGTSPTIVQGTISNNIFYQPNTSGAVPTNGWIHLRATAANNKNGLTITGNYFGLAGDYTSASRVLLSADADFTGIVFTGNTISRDRTAQSIEDAGGFTVSGNFSESVFGPNARPDECTYSVTGSNNLFIPPSAAVGSSTSSAWWPLMNTATELTISSGAITVTQDHHIVRTEGGAGVDELDTINGGVENKWLVIRTKPGEVEELSITDNGNIVPFPNPITLDVENQYALLWYWPATGAGDQKWLAFEPTGVPIELQDELGITVASAQEQRLRIDKILRLISPGAVEIASDQLLLNEETFIRLDVEGGVAASDDLDGLSLVNGNKSGDVVVITPASGSRTIVLKNNNAGGTTGNKLFTQGGGDISLTELYDYAILVYRDELDSGNGGWMVFANNSVTDHLADTSDAHDASAISIVDSAGHYTATDVEAALAEVAVEARSDFRSITVEDPTSSERITIFVAPVAITITNVYSHIVGATNVSFNIEHGTNPTSGADAYTGADEVASATSTITSHGAPDGDATVAAGEAVQLTTSALSGTPDSLHVTVVFTKD